MTDFPDCTHIRWSEGDREHHAIIDKDVLGKFILLYDEWNKIGRQVDRNYGIKPHGYELEDWFINKRLEAEEE